MAGVDITQMKSLAMYLLAVQQVEVEGHSASRNAEVALQNRAMEIDDLRTQVAQLQAELADARELARQQAERADARRKGTPLFTQSDNDDDANPPADEMDTDV